MDKLRSMEVFLAVVERRSLSAAAAALSLSPSMVSTHLSNLEGELGVRLLNRTTRRLNLTDEGLLYHAHCRQIRDDIAAMESLLNGDGGLPCGRLHLDVPSTIAQYLIMPLLPKFRRRYPDIRLHFSDSEQISESVENQYDVMIRLGPLRDSGMIARPLGYSALLTVASPHYLKNRDMPLTPEDLHGHECINYLVERTGKLLPWVFEQDGSQIHLQISGGLSITQGNTRIEAALNGLGIVQGMEFHLGDMLRAGHLQQVLEKWTLRAPRMEILYPQGRRDSRKVHAFIDFLLEHYPADREIVAPPRVHLASSSARRIDPVPSSRMMLATGHATANNNARE
ncbi:LysR substrate-binding domain-containing protein [Pseudomonas citrulli]|uniref:LysR substrate-binding domain-containing protein n=2 Tax=Bacteria TaxID=2 RepID=A0ABY9FP12_9PSED|nr:MULTISPECIES: LysR family transcriptional regulator [Pseudomonas]WLG54815.1 LysR substrate-binding domain-containing protein [Pseudomonas extremorientalis]WLH05051.1 LysR substrate-binding domain-containing protein [Pseudomonas lurida]